MYSPGVGRFERRALQKSWRCPCGRRNPSYRHTPRDREDHVMAEAHRMTGTMGWVAAPDQVAAQSCHFGRCGVMLKSTWGKPQATGNKLSKSCLPPSVARPQAAPPAPSTCTCALAASRRRPRHHVLPHLSGVVAANFAPPVQAPRTNRAWTPSVCLSSQQRAALAHVLNDDDWRVRGFVGWVLISCAEYSLILVWI